MRSGDRRSRPWLVVVAGLIACASIGGGADAARAEGSAEDWHWSLEPPFVPHRARVGVQVQPMTPELRAYFKAPDDRGLLVAKVEPKSAAEAAGIRVGDVILDAGGEPLRRPYDLVRIVGRVPAGGVIELRVLRNEKSRSIELAPSGDAMPWVDPDHWGRWLERGMRRGSEQLRERLEELEERLEELERRLAEEPMQETAR